MLARERQGLSFGIRQGVLLEAKLNDTRMSLML